MSRNGSGEYSLPANTAAVSGATISSTKFNSIMSDLESTLNTARPVVKGGTGATTASAARTNLGLAIGTDVQAHDAGLASIAGLTTAADKMIYTTAPDTYSVADLSAFARTILDDADASAVRTTIGAGTGSGDLLAANNLSDLGSASTARSNLGLGTMAVETAADYAALAGSAFTGDVSVSGIFSVNETTAAVADTVAQFGNATISGALQVITSDGNLVWGFNALNSRNFVIQTNQTERLRIDSGGNVGINTTSPSTILHVRSITASDAPALGAVNGALSVEGGAGGNGVVTGFYDDGVSTRYGWLQAKFLSTIAASYNLALNPVGGNVGINTTSPGAKLDVNGTFAAKGLRNATVSGTLNADDHGRGQVSQISGNITLPAMENASHGVLINNSGTARTITASGVTMYVNQASVASATLAGRGMAGFVYEGSTVVHINGAVS